MLKVIGNMFKRSCKIKNTNFLKKEKEVHEERFLMGKNFNKALFGLIPVYVLNRIIMC